MSDCAEDEDMEFMVLDFSDAFWQVPLHREGAAFLLRKGSYCRYY